MSACQGVWSGAWLTISFTRVGTSGDIQLSGHFIAEIHCTLKREGGENKATINIIIIIIAIDLLELICSCYCYLVVS